MVITGGSDELDTGSGPGRRRRRRVRGPGRPDDARAVAAGIVSRSSLLLHQRRRAGAPGGGGSRVPIVDLYALTTPQYHRPWLAPSRVLSARRPLPLVSQRTSALWATICAPEACGPTRWSAPCASCCCAPLALSRAQALRRPRDDVATTRPVYAAGAPPQALACFDAPRRLLHAARPGLRSLGLEDPVDVLMTVRGRQRRNAAAASGSSCSSICRSWGTGISSRGAPRPPLSLSHAPWRRVRQPASRCPGRSPSRGRRAPRRSPAEVP